MRPDDIHARFQRFTADHKQCDILIFIDGIELIADLDFSVFRQNLVQIPVAVFLCQPDRFPHAFPFRFAYGNKVLIRFVEGKQGFTLFTLRFIPYCFHSITILLCIIINKLPQDTSGKPGFLTLTFVNIAVTIF